MKEEKTKEQKEKEYLEKIKQETFYIRFWRACVNLQKEISSKQRGHNYKYCPIQDLFSWARPILNNEKIAFFQTISFEENNHLIKTKIVDLLNSKVMDEATVCVADTELRGQNKFQSFGSGLTYLRRYSLFCLLNVQPEKDTDAADSRYAFNKQTFTPTTKKL